MEESAAKKKDKEMYYFEKEIWSQRYKLWRKFRVKKARLPNEDDRTLRWIDLQINKPSSLGAMLGTHNAPVVSALNNIREALEDSKDMPPVLVVYGPSGSGKTTIAQKFVQDIAQDLKLVQSQFPKFCFEADAGKYEIFSQLWNKISKFAEPVIERFISATFRIVVIDNADSIPPSQQQYIKRLMEIYDRRLRWVFVCHDSKKLITYIQSMSLYFQTHSISERNGLTVILGLCHRNKIGYDREGIHAAFRYFKGEISLSKIIDFLQRCMVEYSYISAENIAKLAGPDREKAVHPVSEILKPLQRCRICTLYPPCKHITESIMTFASEAAFKALPKNKGATKCPEFMAFGHCSLFTKYGRCPLDHSRDYHNYQPPVRRCLQCTIPWPCNHCSYSQYRLGLLKTIKNIEKRLHLLKQLVVPDPLINVATWLNELYPAWKSFMVRFEKKFLTKSLEDSLASTIAWTQNAYSQDVDEYKFKERLLRLSFQELLESPMLDKAGLKRAIAGEVDDGLNSFGEDEDDLSASVGSSSVYSQLSTPSGAVVAGTAEAAMIPIAEASADHRVRKHSVLHKAHHH